MSELHLFAGSKTLTGFIFRRDRIRLIIWLVSIAAFVAVLVPVFDDLLITGTDSGVMAQMMENPAMIAIVGPVYGAGNYTTGAAYGNMMLLFSAMIAGVMNIFLISRHTRQDEELGRLEMIRSLPVGRLSNMASTLMVSVIVNVILAVVSGLGIFALRAEGMSFSGCMLFGAVLGVTGFFFAASTALLCQLTTNNRTAMGLSFLFLLVLYMLRAVGDMGNETLSLISPLGLILRTENFVHDYWWPIWVTLLIAVVVTAFSFGLAKMRDLGSGLVPERPGRRHASTMLSSSYGLALRLLRTPLILWAAIIFMLAAMYGSVFGELETFIRSNDLLQAIFANDPNFSMTEQFVALLMVIMSIISTIAILSFVHRVAGEEKSGNTEQILVTSVSRYSQLAAYFLPAIIMSVILQILAALGFWSVGSMVLDTAPSFATFLQSALSYLPSIWVMIGLSMVLTAFFPGKVSLSYVYLGYSFVSIYLGTLAGLPEWVQKLSPFGHVPQYPIEELKALPLILLTFIAAALTLLSFWQYRRRDLQN